MTAGKLQGKVAMVTGSGRGIGRAVALKLASEGARLVINDLDIEPAEQVLPGLVGGEQRLGARHDELARTHRSQQLRRRCGLCPAHLPVQAADPGDHLGVAAHGIDNRTDVKGSPHAPSLARRGTPADADAVVDVGCVPAERCRRCAGSLLGR